MHDRWALYVITMWKKLHASDLSWLQQHLKRINSGRLWKQRELKRGPHCRKRHVNETERTRWHNNDHQDIQQRVLAARAAQADLASEDQANRPTLELSGSTRPVSDLNIQLDSTQAECHNLLLLVEQQTQTIESSSIGQ